MTGLNPSQRKIMEYLFERPEGASLDELAEHLGVTRTAAKLHVIRVQDLGYVEFTDTKGAVGRPLRRYRISEEGIDAFPKKYSWLSNVILAQLAAKLGPAGAGRFMRELAATVAEGMRPQLGASLAPFEQLKKVTAILNELGYRATLKTEGPKHGAVIEAVNCVYHSVAKQHPELCQFDVSLIEKTSGMNVKLESCIAKGGAVCRFCLSRKPV